MYNQFRKIEVRENGPTPRGFHRVHCKDSYLFSYGGYDGEKREGFQLWRFDYLNETWTKLRPNNFPSRLPLHSCASALSGNVLFLFGGLIRVEGRLHDTNAIYLCRFTEDMIDVTFERIEPMSAYQPTPRFRHNMVLNGRHLYTVGGRFQNTYLMDVNVFDLETRVWTKLENGEGNAHNSPAARERHGLVYYKNRLYVIGGGTLRESFSLQVIHVFILGTNRWKTLRTYGDVIPRERFGHGCVQHPHQPSIVYVSGGFCAGGSFLNDTWRIDLKTRIWTRVCSLDLPSPVACDSIATTPDGRMFVFGGHRDPRTLTSALYSTWIACPKLEHICWETTLNYLQNGVLKLSSSSELPEKYKQRLARFVAKPSASIPN